MEDISDALKIAFAMLMFALAMTLAFSNFSKAKDTADIVFTYSDTTAFYQYASEDGSKNGRIVGIETIIPTLYRYYKENYIVVIKDTNGNEIERFDLDLEAKIFRGYTDENGVYHKPSPSKAPWMGNQQKDAKTRVDLFVYGGKDIINTYYEVNYQGKGLIPQYKGRKFLETFRIYSNSGITEDVYNEQGEVIDTVEITKGSEKIEITYKLQ